MTYLSKRNQKRLAKKKENEFKLAQSKVDSAVAIAAVKDLHLHYFGNELPNELVQIAALELEEVDVLSMTTTELSDKMKKLVAEYKKDEVELKNA